MRIGDTVVLKDGGLSGPITHIGLFPDHWCIWILVDGNHIWAHQDAVDWPATEAANEEGAK